MGRQRYGTGAAPIGYSPDGTSLSVTARKAGPMMAAWMNMPTDVLPVRCTAQV